MGHSWGEEKGRKGPTEAEKHAEQGGNKKTLKMLFLR